MYSRNLLKLCSYTRNYGRASIIIIISHFSNYVLRIFLITCYRIFLITFITINKIPSSRTFDFEWQMKLQMFGCMQSPIEKTHSSYNLITHSRYKKLSFSWLILMTQASNKSSWKWLCIEIHETDLYLLFNDNPARII